MTSTPVSDRVRSMCDGVRRATTNSLALKLATIAENQLAEATRLEANFYGRHAVTQQLKAALRSAERAERAAGIR